MVVHEWGTFTSLPDQSGEAIAGLNTDREPLPRFVHTAVIPGILAWLAHVLGDGTGAFLGIGRLDLGGGTAEVLARIGSRSGGEFPTDRLVGLLYEEDEGETATYRCRLRAEDRIPSRRLLLLR